MVGLETESVLAFVFGEPAKLEIGLKQTFN